MLSLIAPSLTLRTPFLPIRGPRCFATSTQWKALEIMIVTNEFLPRVRGGGFRIRYVQTSSSRKPVRSCYLLAKQKLKTALTKSRQLPMKRNKKQPEVPHIQMRKNHTLCLYELP